MRVKVGDKWFEPKVGQPVMVVLSEREKQQIAGMPAENRRYAQFHDDDALSHTAMLAWMKAGDPAKGGADDPLIDD